MTPHLLFIKSKATKLPSPSIPPRPRRMEEIRSESIAQRWDFGSVWKSTACRFLKAVETGSTNGRWLWNECMFPFSCLLKLWWTMGPSSTVNPHTPSMSTRLFPTGTPSETSVVGLHHVATWASMEFPRVFHWGLCFLPQCHQCPALKKDLSAKFWKLDESRWSWRKGHYLVEGMFILTAKMFKGRRLYGWMQK